MTVHGIGGIFFKCEDPERTAAWYEQHLGVYRDADGFVTFGWRRTDAAGDGHTVFAPFPATSTYFGEGRAEFMFNLRVDDLDAVRARLRDAGVEEVGEGERSEYGVFAHFLDCDGRRFELWQAPPAPAPYDVTVPATPAELGGVALVDGGSGLASRRASSALGVISKSCTVPVSPDAAWSMWTSSDALARWLVPASRIELRVGGAYELYFLPDAPAGQRGGEGNKVLSYVPGRALAFTWNAPPHLAHARARHTFVSLRFDPVDERGEGTPSTRLTLDHLGWPDPEEDDHPEWAEAFAYFDAAWERVLEAFVAGAG